MQMVYLFANGNSMKDESQSILMESFLKMEFRIQILFYCPCIR